MRGEIEFLLCNYKANIKFVVSKIMGISFSIFSTFLKDVLQDYLESRTFVVTFLKLLNMVLIIFYDLGSFNVLTHF